MGSGNNPQGYPRLWKTKLYNNFNDLRYDFREKSPKLHNASFHGGQGAQQERGCGRFFLGDRGPLSGAGGKGISLKGRVKKLLLFCPQKFILPSQSIGATGDGTRLGSKMIKGFLPKLAPRDLFPTKNFPKN
ncbi:MAG: hypothetical protein IT573_06610 [Deltaproteobacteria bacterium]|nr:hypothetical protein [Deltaproteobacteria bacterium]